MFKGGVLLSGNLNKVFDEGTLRDCEWLSNNQVVALGEEVESKFNEILAPSFIQFINAEEIYDNRIECVEWNFWEFI